MILILSLIKLEKKQQHIKLFMTIRSTTIDYMLTSQHFPKTNFTF